MNKKNIKSFVSRSGRITAAQQNAILEYWETYGLDWKDQSDNYKLLSSFGLCEHKGLILEIGFGMGDATLELAKQYPEWMFLAIDVHKPGIGRLLMRIHAEALTNLKVLQGDAVEFMENCVVEKSMSSILLYFPDPWPKKRHHKRRIVNPEFVNLVARLLQSGGTFNIATDWLPYAEHIQTVVCGSNLFYRQEKNNKPGLQSATETIKPLCEIQRPSSKFEQRGIRLGNTISDLRYIKA